MMQHSFLKNLPQGLASVRGLTASQTDDQKNKTLDILSRFNKGQFTKGEMNSIYGTKWDKDSQKSIAKNLDVLEGKLSTFMRKNNTKLSTMSESEKYKYIMDNVMQGQDMATFAYLQRSGGLSNLAGAVDFKALGGERYSLGNLGNAKQLANELSGASDTLAGSFENKSGVKALLGTDSASRNLFLAASKGDEEARKLIEDKLDDVTKDKLMNKYGIKEGDIEHLRDLYGGRKGDVSDAANNFSRSMDRSSAGAVITQMRRQGIGMNNRLQNASAPVKELLKGLTEQISSLDSSNIGDFLNNGDKVSGILDKVGGLKGDERTEALSILGPGAKTAFDYASGVNRQLHQKGGFKRLYNSSDSETKAYMDQLGKDGKFDEKDKASLTKYLRDKTFMGTLASDGKVLGKDIPGADKMTETIQSIAKNARETADINKNYAQLQNQFSQMLINAVPGLKDAQGTVDGMRQETKQLPNQSLPS
jgi:methyl-accepting chemotaxis protein